MLRRVSGIVGEARLYYASYRGNHNHRLCGKAPFDEGLAFAQQKTGGENNSLL